MAVAMKSWVAKHTGLPSFLIEGVAVGQTVRVDATDGSRTWVAVRRVSTGAPVVASDVLAAPGVETTYTLAGAPSARLSRRGEAWWSGVVTGLDGRPVPGMAWEGDGDAHDWSSPVVRFGSHAARWPLEEVARTGSSVLTVEADELDRAWRLLRSRQPLFMATGAPANGVPPRVVTIDRVASKRVSGNGFTELSVSWTEVPWGSPILGSASGERGAPVVTWGEWDAIDRGWSHRTYLDLCRLIAGMP